MTPVPKHGLLAPVDLRLLAEQGALSTDRESLVYGQNSIKLHAGDVAWNADGEYHKRRQTIDADHPMVVEPGDMASVITQEEVELPLDVAGCIYPRGRVLTVGLFMTTVHVDPGFAGHLRLIVINTGPNRIGIPLGFELARLCLTRMRTPAEQSYRGVNGELKTINPRADDLVLPDGDEYRAGGSAMARLDALEDDMRRLREGKRRLRLGAAVGAFVLLAMGLLVGVAVVVIVLWKGPFGEVAAGVMTTLVIAICVVLLRRFRAPVLTAVDHWTRR